MRRFNQGLVGSAEGYWLLREERRGRGGRREEGEGRGREEGEGRGGGRRDEEEGRER